MELKSGLTKLSPFLGFFVVTLKPCLGGESPVQLHCVISVKKRSSEELERHSVQQHEARTGRHTATARRQGRKQQHFTGWKGSSFPWKPCLLHWKTPPAKRNCVLRTWSITLQAGTQELHTLRLTGPCVTSHVLYKETALRGTELQA